jgi:hypothetical protein
MSRKEVVYYIKKSLSQGYSSNQIRTALINAGHSPYEIDVFLRNLQNTKKKPKKLILIAIILILAIISILFFILISKEEKTPSMKISLLEKQIGTGTSLILKIQIINPSKKKAEAIIDIIVFSEKGNPISQKSKKIQILEYLNEITEQIEISSEPGKYKIFTTAKIGSITLTREGNFEITKKATQEQPTKITSPFEQKNETEKICQYECDDFNICTLNECIDGECVYTEIIPCCGNNICEEGEEETCPEDCKPKERTLADSEIKKQTDDCDKIATIALRDSCFEEAAKTKNSSQLCDKITDKIKKDSCYMHFALKNDFTVCDKIQNKYTQNSCYSLSRMNI